ncbi:MAG: pyridoxal phosphate-dependent aminotransferase [Anaerovoracaceae bacterium]
MIAKSMKSYVEGGSAIRAMFEEGAKMAAEFGPENVYDFSLGNPSVPAPGAVGEAIKAIIDEEESTYVHGYNQSNSGYEDVRTIIAEKLNQRHGVSFSAKNIVMTVGAAGGLNVAFKTLLDPGDEVVAFAPYFVEYKNYAANYGGVMKTVPANTKDFLPDLEKLKEVITEKTKAVIINTPNNPTGVVYSETVPQQLAEILTQKEKEYGKEIYLISDEPYRELVYDGVTVPYVTKYYPNTIVGYSFSKSLSLPGERIGYLVFPPDLADLDNTLMAANIANRILGFVNAPTLIQRAIARCMDSKTDIEAYDKNRRMLYEGLTQQGYSCIKPEGAFYLFVKSPIGDDKEFCNRAKAHHILLVPGSSFACPGYVRIAYCVSNKTIVNALPKFKALWEEVQGLE